MDHTGRIILALQRIGFDEVYEVGAAAELISQSTKEYMAHYQGPLPLISSACPAVLRLIRVRFPDLLEHLLPLQPPVELAAVLARRPRGPLRQAQAGGDRRCVYSPLPRQGNGRQGAAGQSDP